jgi:hypothetical protein
MTKLAFLKYLLVAIGYIIAIGFVLPFLMSAKSTIAGILGIILGVSLLVIVPAFYLINQINSK